MKKIIYFIITILCFSTIKLFSQTLSFKSIDKQPIDSIVILLFKGSVSGNSGFREKIVIKGKTADGNLKFTFPIKQQVMPFTMYFYYGKSRKKSLVYYAEPSDNLQISVTKLDSKLVKLDFAGRGKDKYYVCEIIRELIRKKTNKIEVDYSTKFGNAGQTEGKYKITGKIESVGFHESVEFKNYLDSLYLDVKLAKREIRDILNKYEMRIGKHMVNFYSYELDYYSTVVLISRFLFERAGTKETKKAISDFYLSKIDSITPRPKDQLFKYGLSYRNRMSDYVRYITFYKNGGKKYPFHVEYDAIKKEIENAELREILSTRFFAVGNYEYISNSQTMDSCLNDAYHIIKNGELNAVLKHRYLFSKGTKMYDFAFKDTLDRTTTLSDMKGKVFIIDFYYNGCGSCVVFAKRFADEIYPEFRSNPNFEVLSVNTDKKRESWISAIKSGLYSVPKSLNLTTGVAFNHPIFKEYDIHALPWVLLVDKEGKVVDFYLFRKDSSEIKMLIKKALADSRNSK